MIVLTFFQHFKLMFEDVYVISQEDRFKYILTFFQHFELTFWGLKWGYNDAELIFSNTDGLSNLKRC